MIQHVTSLRLNQPVEQVFAFVVDPRNLSAWQADVVESQPLSAEPLAAGAEIREIRRMGRRVAENRVVVQVFEPNRRFVVRTAGQPQVTVSYGFEPDHGGTKLEYEFVMVTQGFLRLLEPLIAGSIEKQMLRDFERLNQILTLAGPAG